jgi:hypothetical protein
VNTTIIDRNGETHNHPQGGTLGGPEKVKKGTFYFFLTGVAERSSFLRKSRMSQSCSARFLLTANSSGWSLPHFVQIARFDRDSDSIC